MKPTSEKMENTKHETAKHLALFASLGRFGLSMHMLAVDRSPASCVWANL